MSDDQGTGDSVPLVMVCHSVKDGNSSVVVSLHSFLLGASSACSIEKQEKGKTAIDR